MSVDKLITKLKESGEDFEFYPTTDEIIEKVRASLILSRCNSWQEDKRYYCSMLDCGAGDGRVLKELATSNMYAIEKSKHLIDTMDSEIIVVGTEFFESTLIDKPVDVVFCNPPYREYERWAEKIILEANAEELFLVIPSRWVKCESIQSALQRRGTEPEVLGTYGFMSADRKARAVVNLIHIKFKDGRDSKEPFSIWFDSEFSIQAEKSKSASYEKERKEREELKRQIVKGEDLAEVLVALYREELYKLQANYTAIGKLDYSVLKELNVDIENLKKALHQRLTGLKAKYWQELFDNYSTVTNRLTEKSRRDVLSKLNSRMNIDFTPSNIYATTIWVCKNANKYYDTQLIDVYENMLSSANVTLYKSNKRVFEDRDWRYCRAHEGLTHYGLELRVVLDSVGGVYAGDWSYEARNGLTKRAYSYLEDLLTVCRNIGFDSCTRVGEFEWTSGKSCAFHSADGEILFEAKAFKNGNIHVKFNLALIRTMNVEFGRLKGWLHSANQASKDLEIPVEDAEKMFKVNYSLLTHSTVKQLTSGRA